MREPRPSSTNPSSLTGVCGNCGQETMFPSAVTSVRGASVVILHTCPSCSHYFEVNVPELAEAELLSVHTGRLQLPVDISVTERVAASHRQIVQLRAFASGWDDHGAVVLQVMAAVENQGPLWVRVWPHASCAILRDGRGTILETEIDIHASPRLVAPGARTDVTWWIRDSAAHVERVTAVVCYDELAPRSPTGLRARGVRLERDVFGSLIAKGIILNESVHIRLANELTVVLRDLEDRSMAFLRGRVDEIPPWSSVPFVVDAELPYVEERVAAVHVQIAHRTDDLEHRADEVIAHLQRRAADGIVRSLGSFLYR